MKTQEDKHIMCTQTLYIELYIIAINILSGNVYVTIVNVSLERQTVYIDSICIMCMYLT